MSSSIESIRERLFSLSKEQVGCISILKSGNRKNERCGKPIKKNCLCSRHQPKTDTKKKVVLKKKVNFGECMICYDERELIEPCCSFKMCLSCVLTNAKKKCPHCKKDFSNYLPETVNTDTAFAIIANKQEQIDEKEREIQVLRNHNKYLTEELNYRNDNSRRSVVYPSMLSVVDEEDEELNRGSSVLNERRELNERLEQLLRRQFINEFNSSLNDD